MRWGVRWTITIDLLCRTDTRLYRKLYALSSLAALQSIWSCCLINIASDVNISAPGIRTQVDLRQKISTSTEDHQLQHSSTEFSKSRDTTICPMLPARRLYHCSRCLRTESKDGLRLPRPSVLEPLVHPSSPTTKPETVNPDQSIPLREPLSRVSLSYEATRKVPPQNWQKPQAKSAVRPLTPVKNPLVEDDLQRQLNQVRREFFKDKGAEMLAEQSGTRSGRRPLPPVPAPRTSYYLL